MKVKELIEKLQKMNPDYEVFVSCDEQDSVIEEIKSFTRADMMRYCHARYSYCKEFADSPLTEEEEQEIFEEVNYPYSAGDTIAALYAYQEEDCIGIVCLEGSSF